MKDLQQLTVQCMRMLQTLGIRCGRISEVTVNTRALRRWGQCRKLPDGSFSISIAAALLADDTAEQAARETILHELLHTVPGGFSHTGVWKQLAARVNRAYGLNIRATTPAKEKGAGLQERQEAAARYKFVCTGCGAEVLRFRESKFTRNYRNYHCARCGGRFRPIDL